MSRGIKYSKEFKLGALSMLREGRNIREVSESLGVRRETISVWKKQYQSYGDEAFVGSGRSLPKNEHLEELRRLKKEHASLKIEREILKKSVSIFSKSQG